MQMMDWLATRYSGCHLTRNLCLVAGMTSRTAVAPLERLKILFQVQDYLKDKETVGHLARNRPKYDGVWQSLRKIGAEEGLKGYFKGNGANCARVFPYTAIQFAV